MELIVICLCVGGFLIVYPYLALSKIWQLLEKIEKHNKNTSDMLETLLRKEVK